MELVDEVDMYNMKLMIDTSGFQVCVFPLFFMHNYSLLKYILLYWCFFFILMSCWWSILGTSKPAQSCHATLFKHMLQILTRYKYFNRNHFTGIKWNQFFMNRQGTLYRLYRLVTLKEGFGKYPLTKRQ